MISSTSNNTACSSSKWLLKNKWSQKRGRLRAPCAPPPFPATLPPTQLLQKYFLSVNIFGCHNLEGTKYLTSLRLGLSNLYEHKFKNNFQNTLNPLCICGCDVENTCHFLLQCPNFLSERNTLLNRITNFDSNILNQADATITMTLLFGNSKYSNEINLQILNASIDFILTSKRFDEPLLNT